MRGPFFFMFYAICFINYMMSANCLMGFASEFKNETDRIALLAFKDAITWDPNGVLNSWNTSLHYCRWQGVSCSTKHPQRVTSLKLSSQGLVGRIPAHIGNLSFLKVINLENNSVNGEIPQEIGKLFRLRILYLNNNSFHGEIPTNLTGCINLQRIQFYVNNLKSKIPGELGSLHNLEVLILGNNNLEGQIPPSLGNLSSLISLHLGSARLVGSIPEDLGRLTRLKYLTVQGNNLTGTIPSTIFNLSSLTDLAVATNRLEGKLPPDMGITLPNLQNLYFSGNLFTGLIPRSLSNASQLELIDLGGNRFSGPILVELGKLVNLYRVLLDYNKLGTEGGNDLRFISSLTNCTKLEILYLHLNLLKGPLPKSIANLSIQIRHISIGNNQIYGAIPSGIGKLVNLNYLDLRHMMLHRNIPPEIGELPNLVQLCIQGNKLTGPIPSTLGNLTVLIDLTLSENNLSGTIPPSLGNCQKLLKLYLGGNNLQGFIPASIFGLPSLVSMSLSRSYISGSLPPEIGNMKQLQFLYVYENKLSGEIPNALGSCLSLEKIYMYGNSFSGTIPQKLSALRGIVDIDLSHNNLSGKIPEYLEGLPFLQILNLSFNNFEGEVPKIGIFRNVSAISLIGNKKLCGGVPELKLPVCIVLDSDERGISLVLILKVVIPLIVVVNCSALSASFFYLRHRRRKSKEKPAETFLNNKFLQVSYQELLHATDSFSDTNLIGFGGYGSVYKGFLQQIQSFIAVKVFNLQHRGASKSFIFECKALKNIRHRNLLKIISVCSSIDFQGNDFRAVIFEFMPRGSLESWLHPQEVGDYEDEVRRLTFEQRLNIAIDVATAVEYLHCHCQPPVIHGDLKPSNVLLDDDMVAHVGDFGLSKVLSRVSDNQSTTDIIKGSVGYVPPEYGMGGVSIQGDVYSFGIFLLEIFTARRPTDDLFQGDLNLHNFCRTAVPESVMDIVDPLLFPEESTARKVQEFLASVLRVGISCSMETPMNRMDIRNVVRELYMVKKSYERQGIKTIR